jgi:hypothetical protein
VCCLVHRAKSDRNFVERNSVGCILDILCVVASQLVVSVFFAISYRVLNLMVACFFLSTDTPSDPYNSSII